MAEARYAVVMAGGSGERFWPLSRVARPKQLLQMPGSERTMLAEAIERLIPIVPIQNILIVTSTHLVNPIKEAVPDIPAGNILAEPARRNTSGCLVYAAAWVAAMRPDLLEASVIVVPADHQIEPLNGFVDTIWAAITCAEEDGGLVTIGVKPDRPETGYGYVQAMTAYARAGLGNAKAYPVKKFHEKPSADLAQSYVEEGGYFWNSGMFVWTHKTFIDELLRVAPAHVEIINRLVPFIQTSDAAGLHSTFSELPDISIDYLLLERASQVTVVEAGFQWDDLGSWDSLGRKLPADSRGNVASGESVLVQSADCVVYNASKSITVGIAGVHGLLVVVTDDAVLICNKDQAQSVKDVVKQLRDNGSQAL